MSPQWSLLMFTLLLSACGPDGAYSPIETGSTQLSHRPLVREGVVAFRDISEFRTTLRYLQEIGERNLSQWESDIGFPHSLRRETQSYQNKDKLVISPFFASVINAKGQFSVGNMLHTITKEKEYVSEISTHMTGLPEQSDVSYPIQRFHSGKSLNTNDFWGHDKQWKTPCLTTSDYDDSYDYRVELEAWSENFSFYSDLGTRITYQEYKSGGLFGRKKWRDTDAWHLKVDGTAKFRVCPPRMPCSLTITQHEEDEENLETNADVFFNQVYSTGGTTLETDEISTKYEFGNGDCSTNWSMVWR